MESGTAVLTAFYAQLAIERAKMYFFYIDESGSRDVNKTDEPYVLTAVGMYENRWRRFNKHLEGMKTNIARKHLPDIEPDQLEVKANYILRKKGKFFSVLSDAEVNHISKNYLDQLKKAKMIIMASVIDKEELRDGTTSQEMHEWAYKLLLERIQHFMNNHPKHNALIIMDDTGANLNRKIALMHARLLGIGDEVMDFKNIVEYPFFVSSKLSNGVQLADIVAYTIYHSFRYNKPDYEYIQKLRPYISRHRDKSEVLAGLKVWPESEKYNIIFDKIQKNNDT